MTGGRNFRQGSRNLGCFAHVWEALCTAFVELGSTSGLPVPTNKVQEKSHQRIPSKVDADAQEYMNTSG